MADLFDDQEADVPIENRLRLSIRWHSIWYDQTDTMATSLEVGVFIGDRPIFADFLYQRTHTWRKVALSPGYFEGEDNECCILDGLWQSLTTGERMDWEDILEPDFGLVVAPASFEEIGEVKITDKTWYDVLCVIQHGGPWHGPAMGGSGPAVQLSADHSSLKRFFHDLLEEALDPRISDETSRNILLKRHAQARSQRVKDLQVGLPVSAEQVIISRWTYGFGRAWMCVSPN